LTNILKAHMNTKKTTKGKQQTPTPPTPATPTGPAPAMVHDLVGAAILILPKELRSLIGDQALQTNAQELQDREVVVIVREPGVVAYVHLPIIAMEMEGAAMDLAEGGTKLTSITGAWSQRLKERIKGHLKSHDLVTVVESADQGGRHA